ncbi:MAG: DHH family phosphoesterase [Pseudomonadota bacterium]
MSPITTSSQSSDQATSRESAAASFKEQDWILPDAAKVPVQDTDAFAQKFAQLRDLPQAGLCHPTLREHLPNPSHLSGMDALIARLHKAIIAQEKIAIFGDYDVDGVTSVALLGRYLADVGIAATFFLPDRHTDGYGPSIAGVNSLKGHDLVIFVDCGANAPDILTHAHENGMDVLVIDHHVAVAKTVPPFVQIVNPHMKDAGERESATSAETRAETRALCACGLVFLALVALNRRRRQENLSEVDLKLLLDLVALATVADCMTLTPLNRALIRHGLARIIHRKGLAALLHVARRRPPLAAQDISFSLAPRLNAAGRLGHPQPALDLLLCDDSERATALALHLDQRNTRRQHIERNIIRHISTRLETMPTPPFIFEIDEGWPIGVVGIIAGQLARRFACPAIIGGIKGDQVICSARSPVGIDIGAVIRQAGDLIERGGGHTAAAGLTCTRAQVPALRAFLTHTLKASQTARPRLWIDHVSTISEARRNLLTWMAPLGPFGHGHAAPLIVLPHCQVREARVVGADHVSARLAGAAGATGSDELRAIAFRCADQPLGQALLAPERMPLHLAGHIEQDMNGQSQLVIIDAAYAYRLNLDELPKGG